jgi:hypothetical protein
VRSEGEANELKWKKEEEAKKSQSNRFIFAKCELIEIDLEHFVSKKKRKKCLDCVLTIDCFAFCNSICDPNAECGVRWMGKKQQVWVDASRKQLNRISQ